MPLHAAGQLGWNNFSDQIGASKIPGGFVGITKSRNRLKAIASKTNVVTTVIRELN